MRLAIDGRALQSRPIGGIGRIVRSVLPELPGHGIGPIDVLVDGRLAPPDVPSHAGIELHELRAPLTRRGAAWLELAVPRWLAGPGRGLGVDAFHCPLYGLPRRQPVPMVASIYDTTFLQPAAWMTRAQRTALRLQAGQAARTARAIITGSETAAGELRSALHVDARRIVVAPPGVDPVFSSRGGSHSAPATGGGRYVVAMAGSLRRNVETAVAAWRVARAKLAPVDVALVVVGPVGREERRAAESAGARVTGPVGDTGLAELLAGAVAFLYPTHYEGVGLPALEAMACGIPVVCARVGALPELLGDAAEWSTGTAVDQMAAALGRVLDDPARAEGISRAGRCRVRARPSASDSAEAWAGAYQRAAGA